MHKFLETIKSRIPFKVLWEFYFLHPSILKKARVLTLQGAWQPSLNISTVLTSIGLLLSEPNPDDGLMCEAVSICFTNIWFQWLINKLMRVLLDLQSREYKYNRQAFDQKARSMTEKYAQPGATGKICRSHLIESHSNSNMVS